MCKIIDYSNPKSAIRTLVDDEYVSYLEDLLDDITIYPNAQPKALFINEYGLYTLLIRSKKQKAKKFFKWIIEEVIPSVVKKGYYEMENKYKGIIDELEQAIKSKTLQIQTLKNNQSTKHISVKGKYMYIVKSYIYEPIDLDSEDVASQYDYIALQYNHVEIRRRAST